MKGTPAECRLTDSRNRRRSTVVRKFRWMSVAQASRMSFRFVMVA